MSDSTDSSPPPRGFTSEELIRWERVRQRLRVELGDAIYDSWFAGLELERVDGDGVQLTVPTKFLKSWMQTHYLDRIRARVAAEFGTVERVTIELRTPGRKVKARKAEAERTAPAPQDQKLCSASSRRAAGKPAAQEETDGFNGSPLDRRLSFSTFLVGPSNQLAYAAACRVAEQHSVDIAPFFNPLYTHAAVGLARRICCTRWPMRLMKTSAASSI